VTRDDDRHVIIILTEIYGASPSPAYCTYALTLASNQFQKTAIASLKRRNRKQSDSTRPWPGVSRGR